jgi:hypothetical protein
MLQQEEETMTREQVLCRYVIRGAFLSLLPLKLNSKETNSIR